MLHYCRSITASSALLFLALPILSFTLISSSLNLESLHLLREIDTGSRLVFPCKNASFAFERLLLVLLLDTQVTVRNSASLLYDKIIVNLGTKQDSLWWVVVKMTCEIV